MPYPKESILGDLFGEVEAAKIERAQKVDLEPPADLPIIEVEEAPEEKDKFPKQESEDAIILQEVKDEDSDLITDTSQKEVEQTENPETEKETAETEAEITEVLEQTEDEIKQEIEKRGWEEKFIKFNKFVGELNAYNLFSKIFKLKIESKSRRNRQ